MFPIHDEHSLDQKDSTSCSPAIDHILFCIDCNPIPTLSTDCPNRKKTKHSSPKVKRVQTNFETSTNLAQRYVKRIGGITNKFEQFPRVHNIRSFRISVLNTKEIILETLTFRKKGNKPQKQPSTAPESMLMPRRQDSNAAPNLPDNENSNLRAKRRMEKK